MSASSVEPTLTPQLKDRSDLSAEDLRRALDRLSQALATMGLGVWERDIAADRVTWSDAMHRLFGRTAEEFSGSPDQVLSFVHPDDRAATRAGYQNAVQGAGDHFEQEFRIVRPGGEVRWVFRRGQVHRAADGRALSVLGVALDITERKQAEAADAQLAAIASAADDAIIGLTADGIILAWNPAAERMFGYPAGEAIARSARMLYPERAGPQFEDLFQRLRSGEIVRNETACLRRDGAMVDVSVAATPVRSREGRVVGVAAVMRDVGEHRRMQTRLVEALAQVLQAHNRHKLALLAGGMGTFEIDLARGAVACSDEVYAQVGIATPTPIVTLGDVSPFLHPDDRAGVLAGGLDAYRSGKPYESEFRVVRADGQVRWLYVRAQPLPAGNATHVYGVSMDVTERKEREAHIRFLMSEVSHRAKNLLAVVQAIASQTARATGSPIEFAADFSGRLKSLAGSLDLLVRQDWLGVSTVELVQLQLGHWGEGVGRASMQGPDLLLTPAAAQYLGMALHELSANAVKHGALSGAAGHVQVEWRLAGPPGARRFQMSWVESGGARVSPPASTGFGRLVVERLTAEALQGEARLEFPEDGLRWYLDADAAATVRGPAAA